jgi:hypothetical protein
MRMAFFAAVLEIPAIVFTARKVSLVLNGHTTDRSHCGWVWVGQEGVVTVVEGILEGVVGESSSSNSVPEGFGRICRESVSRSQFEFRSFRCFVGRLSTRNVQRCVSMDR